MFWRRWFGRGKKSGSVEEASDRERSLHRQVFPGELRYLRDRWQAAGTGHPEVEGRAQCATRNNLVGMALSGGGIRSASFNLGILQALDRRGAFKHIDYLSTVSGGGFLGSSLSALMSEPARRGGAGGPRPARGEEPAGSGGRGGSRAGFPFGQKSGAMEGPEVRYLRNNSNYLATRGLLDYLRIAAVLVRGILLNFLVLVPFLLLVSMVVILIYGQDLLTRLEADDDERGIAVALELGGWVGTDGDEAVASLMDTLQQGSLIASHRRKNEHDVLHALRGRGDKRQLEPLITGQLDVEELGFRRGVTDREVVRRLRQSGALVELEAAEEIARIENRVDTAGGFAQGLGGVQVGELQRAMDEVGIRVAAWELEGLAEIGDVKRQATLPLLRGDEKTLARALETAGLIGELTSSKQTQRQFRDDVTLRRAIYELYVHGQFDPRWVEKQDEGLWQLEPPAYWEFVELALVRAELENLLDAAAADPGARGAAAAEDPAGLSLDFPPDPGAAPAFDPRAEPFPAAGAEPPPGLGPDPGPAGEPAAETTPVEWLRDPCAMEMLACPGRPQRSADAAPASTVVPSPETEPAGEGPAATAGEPDGEGGVSWRQRSRELRRRLGPLRDVARARAAASEDAGPDPRMQVAYGEIVRASDAERILDEVARGLYYDGLIEKGWLRVRRDEAYPQVGEIHLAYDRFLDPPPPAPWDPHRFRLPWTARMALLGVIWVMLYPLLLWLERMAQAAWPRWTKWLLSCGLLVGGGIVALVAAVGLWMTDLLPSRRDVLIGLALAAALLAGLAYLRRRRSALWWRDRLERSFSGILVAIAVAAFIELQPYIIYHYRSFEAGSISWSIFLGAASLLASMAAGPLLAVLKTTGRLVVLATVALLGPLLPGLIYIHLVDFSLYAAPLFWSHSYVLDNAAVLLIFLFATAVVHVVNLPLDINSTSLHGFYRDRLSRAFLIGHDERGAVRPEDDLGLEEICQEGSGAPYQLINVALNLQGSDDPTVRRRKSDFFTFSRDHVGGPLTGYCETRSMLRVFPNLYLSSATAISAAAAAPNMGTFTFAPLVILMALLNVRLGFWLPNPSRARVWGDVSGGWLRRSWKRLGRIALGLTGAFRARPGAYFLLNEMLSRMNHEGNFVNLSDGGHIENTGAYELLRRRCRFIIVGDAEADPEMRFTGLANLLRYARIDLGIEIELAVDDLELDDDGRSRQHGALGVIRYPAMGGLPREEGYLLYLKSSVSGDEDEVIAEYRKRSRGFPHESTADQSFTEGQFEAYRGLGEHVAEGLFPDESGLGGFDEFRRWFLELRTSLSPGRATGTPAPETEAELAAISRELRRPELVGYFYEIHPELAPEGFRAGKAPAGPEAEATGGEGRDPEGREFLTAFQLAGRQLLLMQSLFVQLELDRRGHRSHPGNRGWMNLFQSWARSPTFQRAYLRLITSGSGAFQEFCETALGLALEFHWTAMRRSRLLAAAGGERVEKGRRPIVGRLELRLKKRPGQARLEDRIHIGYLRLTASGVEVDLLPGSQGIGLESRARLALGRWALNHGIPLERLQGVMAPSPRTSERPLPRL